MEDSFGIRTFLREPAGGMRSVRKSSIVSSGVVARDGLTAVHPEDITMRTAA